MTRLRACLAGFLLAALAAPVVAANLPGAPTGVTASVSNFVMVVDFTPPADDGGSPITSYTVRSSPATTPFSSPHGPPALVTGLTEGVAYTFTVSAVNAVGEGPQSTASNSMVFAVAPATDVRAMGGDGIATVSFQGPGAGSPSPIASFEVISSPGGFSASGTRSPIRVAGLANGTAYTFTVTTHHTNGTSQVSSASNGVTSGPIGARTSPWAYVPSAMDSMVVVIDTATDRAINTIDVCSLPNSAAANSAGTRVYVACSGFGDSVNVIDTASQAVVARISIPGSSPWAIAVDPSGTHVYVTDVANPSVYVIDATTNTVTATISLPEFAQSVDFDPTGATAYLSFLFLQKVARIDTSTNTVAATSDVLPIFPSQLAAGSGGAVYVGDAFGGQLATLDGTTLQSVTGLPAGQGTGGVAIDPSNHRVYFARNPQDGSPGSLNWLGAGSASVGHGAAGVAITPSGGKVYVTNVTDNTVSAVDAASMTTIATIPVGNQPRALGRFIAIADPETQPARLGNISTRMLVLTGDNVMIAGFVIGGATPKTVAITATGPSLVPFGITNPLANPMLTLVRQSDHAVVATNDDWQTDPNAAQLVASGFAPTNALESGLVVTLPPGAYTVVVQGAGGDVGVAVTGVFELDHPEVPLVNISTRGLVLTGDNVMIAGLIVQGSSPQTVVITATGPSLAPFGITNPLSDPTLMLVRQSDHAVIATNDNWQSAPNAAQISASGLAPTDPHESAMMVTLDPGAYTAIVQGVGGGSGVSVVGVFATGH